jgi:flagellar hook assembly protein FlgD
MGAGDGITTQALRSRVRIGYNFSALGRLRILIRTTSNQVIRTLLNQAIRTAGPQTEFWDGRRDDGAFHAGAFNVFYDVPVALPLNAIVLSRPLPAIDDFRAQAYLIQPVFAEVSALTYTLTRDASISITLTDPNGNAVRTLLSSAPQTAGPQSLEWDGRTDSGELVAVEGAYRVTMAATDSVSGLGSTRIGTLTVYK